MAKVKLLATRSLAGKFKMPHDEGQTFSVEEKQAAEIIKAGYAIKAPGKGSAE